MDVATVLVAAASVIGTKAIDESTKLAIADLWSSMKSAVKRKWGADSDAIDVIGEVERLPADTPPSPALSQRVVALELQSDPEIAAVLLRIEDQLKALAQSQPGKKYNFWWCSFYNAVFN